MYVLTRLVEDRRVSQKDVGRYVKEMAEEINTLEERLRRLRGAQSGGSARPARRARALSDDSSAQEAPQPRRGKRRRKRQNLSPERIATLKLQGQYLAMMRKLSERQRAQYKKMFRERGLLATVNALHLAGQEQ